MPFVVVVVQLLPVQNCTFSFTNICYSHQSRQSCSLYFVHHHWQCAVCVTNDGLQDGGKMWVATEHEKDVVFSFSSFVIRIIVCCLIIKKLVESTNVTKEEVLFGCVCVSWNIGENG